MERLFFEGQCQREQSQACLGSAEPKKQREQRANAFALCRVASEEDDSQCSLTSIFYQLLQVAIGNRRSLSRVPTAREWGELYDMATRQAITGVCFVALQRLQPSDGSTCSPTKELPETLRLRWLGMAAKIQQCNQLVNEECVAVTKQLVHDGLACCILKGQGNLVNYPEELREARNPGDIDVWCWPQDPCGMEIAVGDLDGKGAHYEHYEGTRGVIEYAFMQARLAGKPMPVVRYNHVELSNIWTVDVEIHHRPVFLSSPVRNWCLQRWFTENEQFVENDYEDMPVPTNSFNAVYQLCHIYRHLFEEGIGLRQLLDYYFVLRALHIEQGDLSDRTDSMAQWAEGMGIAVKSNAEIMHTLSQFGMKKFAGAVMYVLQTVFAMPDVYLLCPPNEKEGKFLLNEIMQAGNFGKYDELIKHGGSKFSHAIEKTKHNLRLLTHYPEEVLCEPFFRVYHWIWRRFELWRW